MVNFSTDNNGNKKSLLRPSDIYIIVAFFGFVLGLLIFTFFTPNYYELEEPFRLDISKGETLSQVIDSLYAKEVIPSKMNMRIAAFLYGAEKKIKAGRYEIKNGLSYLQLVELLLKGATVEQIKVTIPEGIWQYKLAGILKNELSVDSARFMDLSSNKSFISSLGIDADNIEGYLLPDTYYFYPKATSEDVIRKLTGEMNSLFDDKAYARMKELHMTKNQILTMASIVQGESGRESEYKKIAAVYYNRLKKGMLLQADPTIQYLIREKRKNKSVYFKDLEIKSEYNTYLYPGLPPSPINNPGKAAIMAALYPDTNNYLYFVADGSGGHVFSSSYSEHLRNVGNYRQWVQSQKQ